MQKNNNDTHKIEWLLKKKPDDVLNTDLPEYGDLTKLNKTGMILNLVGHDLLKKIVSDSLELVGTFSAVHEKNGDYALEIISSDWCRILDLASRKLCKTNDNADALKSGKWICHECCWTKTSKISLETKKPVDIECDGNIRIYAVPVFANKEVVGSVNISYGDPPVDLKKIYEISKKFEVDPEILKKASQSYKSRPEFIIDLAKKRARFCAGLIGAILEYKLAKSALVEESDKLKFVINAAKLGTWQWNIQNNKTVFNETWATMLGYELHELYPFGYKTWEKLVHPDDVEDAKNKLKNCIEGRVKDYDCELRMKHKNGSWVWILDRGRVMTRDFMGNPLEMYGTHTDITEKKLSESALRESEEKFRSLFQDHSAVKLIIDPETGRIVDANIAASQFYGWSVDQLCSMKISEINTLPPEEIKKEINRARNRGKICFEFSHRKSDGSVVNVEVFTSRVFIDKKEFLHSIIHDVTEKKNLEKQLFQMQKLESVGRLAGGVAHDFNNKLSVIMGYSELALSKTDKSSKLYSELEEIHKAALSSADITRQLLAFARKQTIIPKILDLNEVVESMLKMLRRLIGEDLNLVWIPGHSLWETKIDPSQVDQIMANLCVNARDAIAGKGKIIIETENISLDKNFLQASFLIPGDYVLLSVSDNGFGMDKETIDNIFEPFFTTKARGKGTGLGLATVYGIVKQNRGYINVYSEVGKGSVFKIYFPRYTGKEEGIEKNSDDLMIKSKGETVLLVEDDRNILEIGKKILEELGYNTICFDKPLKAISFASKNLDKIDILLTDVVMPEMNGFELSERISKIIPELKILFMSGYTADVIANQGVLKNGTNLIEKPFSLKVLGLKIRELLDKN
ncbi:MAG: PAS domain S-box protein [Desulforegulaceae bacterium]|nr:PAS domain S-box protein [Desulforegulaceae bacterium]